jgi:flagellar M-ring protein FliF
MADSWRGMSGAGKLGVAVLTVSLLLAFVLFVRHFTTPSMSVLFRGLNPDNAAKILSRLDEMAVPYEIGAGGGTILVPGNRVDELRIRLNSDGGLYGSGVGFELFDQTKLGVTESERRLNYQRALQGELQRTISQIDGVAQARVHLVLPEPSVFLRETVPPTASVVLKLNPLSRLRKDQVMGIVYLVAGSVENLKVENITVIDTGGNLLTDMGDNGYGMEGLASSTLRQLEVKKAFEREMEHRIQSMLERVLGSGTVVAMVTADLDFNSREVTELTYGEPAVRSRQRSEERFEGSGTVPAGGAGTESNIPAYPYALGTGTGDSTYNKLEEVENFELAETLTRTVIAPGEVKSISASVIYDNSRGTFTPRQKEEIESLVATAIGYSDGRDKISIASINFDTSRLDETIIAMEEAARLEQRNTYIRYGVTAVAALLAFLLVLSLLKSVFSYMGSRTVAREVAVTREEVVPQKWDNLPEEVKKQRKVREMVSEQPEAAFNMLKLWMAEE